MNQKIEGNNLLLLFLIGCMMGVFACGILVYILFFLPVNQIQSETEYPQIGLEPITTNSPKPIESVTQELTIKPTQTSQMVEETPKVPYIGCIPQNDYKEARVIRVIDGDTIEIEMKWQNFTLRYIGIDAPEIDSSQYLSSEAAKINAELVDKKNIIIVRDVTETDSFGRMLGYVIVDGIFVNRELVARGFATANNNPPDTACSQVLDDAMAAAKAASLGLWTPISTPKPIKKSNDADGREGCDPSYPEVCIAPPPPDKDCDEITDRNFRVLEPDPHGFDGDDNDGIGCEG